MKAQVRIQASGRIKEFEIEADSTHIAAGAIIPTDGICFFCPECSSIWASILVPNRPSSVITIPCSSHHQSLHWPGGSLFIPWAPYYKLSGEWLEFEFWRHIEIWEAHKEAFE